MKLKKMASEYARCGACGVTVAFYLQYTNIRTIELRKVTTYCDIFIPTGIRISTIFMAWTRRYVQKKKFIMD
jgi:hypothetical protein